MMGPFRGDIVVLSKNVRFVGRINVPGFDYSAASFRMQVRPQAGQTGQALFQLATPAQAAEGITAAYDPLLYSLNTQAQTGGSVITVRIDASTLGGLNWLTLGVPPTDPLRLSFDLLMTLPPDPERLLLGGNLIIYPGTTTP